MTSARSDLNQRLAGVKQRAEPVVALVADFSTIEHGGDSRFFVSLLRYLDAWVGQVPHELFRLAGPRLVVLAPVEARQALEHAAQLLGEVLLTHGFGAARFQRFDLPGDLGALNEQLGVLPAGATPAARAPDAEDLATFLRVERALHSADISVFVHEVPIFDFAPGGSAAPVLVELAVAIEEVEARLGLALDGDPRVLHDIVELLDERLLRHVVSERGASTRRFLVQGHVAAVTRQGFLALVGTMPGDFRHRIAIALPWLEAAGDPAGFANAVGLLHRHGFQVALDRIPAGAGEMPVLAPGVEVELVRLMLPAKRTGVAAAGGLAAAVARFGAERVILGGCRDRAEVDAGLAAGLRLFQGKGATQRAAELGQMNVAAAEQAEEAPAETVEGGQGWLDRLHW